MKLPRLNIVNDQIAHYLELFSSTCEQVQVVNWVRNVRCVYSELKMSNLSSFNRNFFFDKYFKIFSSIILKFYKSLFSLIYGWKIRDFSENFSSYCYQIPFKYPRLVWWLICSGWNWVSLYVSVVDGRYS